MIIVVFFVVLFAVLGLLHLYLWKRLVKDTFVSRRRRRVGGWVTVALAVMTVGTLIATRSAPISVSRWIAWPGYVWLAIMFYLFVILLVLEIPRLVLRLTWARGGADPSAPAVSAAAGSVGVSRDDDAASSSSPASSDDPASGVVGRDVGVDAVASPGAAGPAGTGAAAPDTDGAAPNPSRRLLLARGLAVAAGVTSVATVGYGMTQALGGPQLDRVRVPLARLPRGMDGFRIAVVSDIHLGPLAGRAHTTRIVDAINGTDPDLIAIVGDLVDGSVEELGAAAEPLARLRATHGSFYVTGNHEYYSGYEQWIDEAAELGLRPLQNERVEIDGLDLAGVNDVTGDAFAHGPDFEKTLGDRDRDKAVVLLAHQPVVAEDAARYGVDLQLSGHTHGGQIQPFGALVAVEQPIVSGLGTVDGTKVYVTNGAGFWGPPVRVGAPPQVSVIELRTT
ncbi:membrane protein [Virgisporangium aliadipatigenens]|uniref:Membrane protein n=1 Tax=Virgisporangium aliadipatigenens TaxID=741659 RepID=A0A8J4DW43_9ACTN|nr:metallophosphoesterase [Virgisporangium aliadipatigenens]GIJ50772.1 membrane protein [Virgisporangium aliadipatigenens]